MRVLLVDDEPPALERLEAFFANMPDIEVVGTAANGLEANDKIAALSPDLVMLDIQMPPSRRARPAASGRPPCGAGAGWGAKPL